MTPVATKTKTEAAATRLRTFRRTYENLEERKEKAFVSAYKAGLSTVDIGKIWDLSPERVRQILLKRKVKMRGRNDY